MKLSLKMICERLESKVNILKFKDIYSTLRLRRPVFLTTETVLETNTLYIATADRLSDDLKYQEGCAIIISGNSDTNVINAPAVILAEDSVDIFTLHNMVSQIFDFFDEWTSKLEYISTHYGRLSSFERFLDASTKVFDNLLAISDPSFNYITSSKYTGPKLDSTGASAFSFDKLPDDVLAILRKNPAHRMLNSEKEIFVAADPEFPHRVMIRNIFHSNSVMYRVTVSETVRPFTETDYLYLEYLAGFIEKAIHHELDLPSSDVSTLSGVFLNAIITGTWTKRLLETELEKIQWHTDDQYAVIVVASPNQNLLLDSIPYYCKEIIKDFPGVMAISHRGNIIIIINVRFFNSSKSEESQDEELNLTELSRFITDNGMTAGVSNIFTSIYNLKKYYRQAEIAHELGRKERPDLHLYKFSSYVLNYMFNMSTSEFTPEDLMSPIYLRLKKYDEENNSEYLKTLKEYLVQNMNAVQTASALYIHRATLIYRMKRICEIGQTELKKPGELLHLALSFGLSRDLD